MAFVKKILSSGEDNCKKVSKMKTTRRNSENLAGLIKRVDKDNSMLERFRSKRIEEL